MKKFTLIYFILLLSATVFAEEKLPKTDLIYSTTQNNCQLYIKIRVWEVGLHGFNIKRRGL